MRSYESILVFKPQLNDDQVKKEVESFQNFLTSNGAQNVKVEDWGRRELAYEMNKSNYGVYQVFTYECADGEIVNNINASCRINDGVLKFQTHRAGSTERGFKGNPLLLKKDKGKAAA